jgi:hypothetical protein
LSLEKETPQNVETVRICYRNLLLLLLLFWMVDSRDLFNNNMGEKLLLLLLKFIKGHRSIDYVSVEETHTRQNRA